MTYSVLGSVGLALAALVLLNAGASRTIESPQTHPSRLLWTRLQTAKGAEADGLAAEARSILRSRPMDARAASLIATVDAQRGATAKADEMMTAAFGLNRRDVAVNAWLFDQSMKARRYQTGFMHADIMLRRSPDLGRSLYPLLISSLADPAAVRPLAQVLKDGPNWRLGLLQAMSNDERTLPFLPTLMLEIQSAGGKIQPDELSTLLARLTDRRLFDQAYLNWLLFNPIEDLSKLRNVYDGDFDGWTAVYPFSWQFNGGISGAIESAKSVNRSGSALHINYDGVSAVTFPAQMIMLTPGDYRLGFDYLTVNDEAAGRLFWQIVCVTNPASPLVKVQITPTRGQWLRRETDLRVPPDCPAQLLSLQPVRGDQRVLADAWFDKVVIDPVGRSAP